MNNIIDMAEQQKLSEIHFEQLKGLKNVTFSLGEKNVTGIFGPNGCGKSTILHVSSQVRVTIHRQLYFSRICGPDTSSTSAAWVAASCKKPSTADGRHWLNRSTSRESTRRSIS